MKNTNLRFWSLYKGILLEDLNESHLNLHEGKPHSNTVSRAPAERHVAESRSLCLLLRGKPVVREEQIEGRSERKEEREKYLSGSNFSGSGQNSGL